MARRRATNAERRLPWGSQPIKRPFHGRGGRPHRFRNPIPGYANLFNLAHGNGTYVVLGRGLGIHRTADFATWQTDYLDQFLDNVIFADGGFTASGSGGEILRSTDGGP